MVAPLEIKKILHRIFLVNWTRKLVALITALIVWFLVNQTLTITKTFSDVPVKVINLPKGKTLMGMLPGGLLNKRIAVTITGTKSFVEELNPHELEVVINAEGKEDNFIAKIDKKSLTSLSPNLDLKSHITEVSSNDLFIKVSEQVTDEILVTITKPRGDPPKGYQFLDVWPKYLRQKVSGPLETIQSLKECGLELTFDLDRITQEELDQLSRMTVAAKTDEVSFYVPKAWKQLQMHTPHDELEFLNDPAAKYLRIVFLKQELIPLGTELPITIFFPLEYSRTINPQTYSLETNDIVQKKSGLKLLTLPLYVQNVSTLFLDIVRENLLLTIIASPSQLQKNLHWTLECIDAKGVEELFVEASLNESKQKDENHLSTLNEEYLRNRFRHYLRGLKLYISKDTPLDLSITLDADMISIKVQE